MKNYPPPCKSAPETVVWKRTLPEKALRYFAKFLLLFVPQKSRFGRMLHARVLWKARVTDYHRFVVKEVTGLVKTFDGTCDVLALGSSHIRCALHPESAKSLAIWNGGVGFCDYHGLYWIYRWYRKRWPYREGQTVVVGEDFWQAATRMECSFDFFRAVSNHIFFDVPYYYPAIFSRPYESYVRFIASLPDSVKSGQQDDRFSKDKPAQPQAEIPHNAMVDVTGSSARFHWEALSRYKPVEVKWLKRLLDAIERDGRKAIVVRTPLHEGYRTNLRPRSQGPRQPHPPQLRRPPPPGCRLQQRWPPPQPPRRRALHPAPRGRPPPPPRQSRRLTPFRPATPYTIIHSVVKEQMETK